MISPFFLGKDTRETLVPNERKKEMTMKHSYSLKPNLLLTQARKELGLSQAGLAKHLGVSEKEVRRWEHGESQPYPRHRQLLRALFHKTEEELGLAPLNQAPANVLSAELPVETHFRAFVEACRAHPFYQSEYHAFLARSQQFHQQQCSVSFIDWFLAAHPELVVISDHHDERGLNQPA
jgi:DNA-binding transcriptional regulator YiaG